VLNLVSNCFYAVKWAGLGREGNCGVKMSIKRTITNVITGVITIVERKDYFKKH